MRLFLLFLTTAYSFAAMADCEIWKISIVNTNTKEEKTYSFGIGKEEALIAPDLKDYKCVFAAKKYDKGISSNILCDHLIKGKSDSFVITGASCVGSYLGSGSLTISQNYNGSTKGYSFYFGPEN